MAGGPEADDQRVSPEQIDAVTRTWSAAVRDPDRLEAAVVERLPGGAPDRARWLVCSVSRLTSVLDRPTTFTAGEAAVTTVGELAVDRAAVLGAVRSVAGPLAPADERAWALALDLFDELVSARCLDPFGCREGADHRNHTADAEQGEIR